MSFYMPSAAASSSLRQAGFTSGTPGFRPRRPVGEERGDGDAKAKRDSPARKRSVSGSGDDAA